MSQFFLSRYVIAISLMLALFGCGGDKETNSTSTPPKEVFPVVALDGFSIAAPEVRTFIDLSSYIRGGAAHLDSVSYTASDVEGCQSPTLRGIGFDVMSTSGALCDYQFRVSNAQTSDSALMKVLFTNALNPILPPLSHAMKLNGPKVVFNLPALLGSDWPTGYSLNAGSVRVQGSENNMGSVTISGDNITYTAPDLSGWNRIIFTLSNVGKPNENIMGTIYVTISESINQPPIINKPKYDYNSKVKTGTPNELGCVRSKENCIIPEVESMFKSTAAVIAMVSDAERLLNWFAPEGTTMDGKMFVINNQSSTTVSVWSGQYDSLANVQANTRRTFIYRSKWTLTSNYDPDVITGKTVDIDLSRIVTEPDAQEWQLVEAQSYTATVKPKNANSITNKIISFTAGTPGKHIISYVVADHYGGYSMGLIEVQVTIEEIVATWSTLSLDGRSYVAPLRYIDGINTGFSVTPLWDDTVKNTISGYNVIAAKAYCNTIGRIPSESEMKALRNKHFTTADATGELNKWPAAKPYWVSNDANTGFLGYDITTGTNLTDMSGGHYVTCINSNLAITMHSSQVVANNKRITIATINKSPSATLILSKVDTGLPNDLLETDVDLKLVKTISDTEMAVTTQSTKSGVYQFKVGNRADNTNEISSPLITYISDITTASLTSLRIIVDNEPANMTSENKLTAMMTDGNGNPVIGQKITVTLAENGTSLDSAKLITPESALVTNTNGEVNLSVTNAESETVDVTATYTPVGITTVGESSQTTRITFK